MSNEEKIYQEHNLRSMRRGFFRVTFMQLITIGSIIAAAFSWYTKNDEKQIIDGTVLAGKVDNLRADFKNSRMKDSVIRLQQRFIDSVSLDKKFTSLQNNIYSEINRKLITTDQRLRKLEERVKITFVEEVKKHGPTGPVTIEPSKNK